MNPPRFLVSALCLVVFSLLPASSRAEDPPPGAQALLAAYPEQLAAYRDGKLIWRDGADPLPYDDGKTGKTPAQLFDGASPKDQFLPAYPAGKQYPDPPPADFDPGRYRCEPFFLHMYGRTAAEVESRLARVVWMPQSAPQTLRVTRVNGVNDRLAAVAAEIEKLPPELRRFAVHSAGTFNWRKVARTERLSAHSFGIAIDLNVDFSDYWQWAKPGADGQPAYRNRIPWEIIEIFERHGFIWGGKWNHFDTMHFEYRPELLGQKG